MHLVSFKAPPAGRVAVLVNGEALIFDIAQATLPVLSDVPSNLRALLESGSNALAKVRDAAHRVSIDPSLADQLRAAGALRHYEASELSAPIPNPGLLLAAGMNYLDHLAEMKTPPPALPYAFPKSAASITGPVGDIRRPPAHPDMVDWEGELAVVISREAHCVSEEEALDYVAGYMVANDVSARDWVRLAFSAPGIMEPIQNWDRNLLGKQYPTFCPLGPALVTADEVPDPQQLQLVTRVDGEVVQNGNTCDMIFPVARIIAYYSAFYALQPGDVVLTGTPAGAGVGRKPQRFLQPGETVEVEIERLGLLRNTVV